MANTLKFGNGNWATKKGSTLAYNDENNNYKPLPFEFSRVGTATRVNKEGLIETVGSGVPRVDYKDYSNGALLLEPQRTNACRYSNDFNSWSKTNVSVDSDVAISPDGGLNADRITFDGTSNARVEISALNINLFENTKNRPNSVWLKTESGTFDIEFGSGTLFLRTVTVTNEWQRFEHISKQGFMRIKSDVAGSVLAYGYQFETNGDVALDYVTSYIPTSGTAITRTKPVTSSPDLSANEIINSTEGTYFIVIKSPISTSRDASTGGFVLGSDNSFPSPQALEIAMNSDGLFRIGKRDNGNFLGLVNTTMGVFHKIAFKWSSLNVKLFVDGTEILKPQFSPYSSTPFKYLYSDTGDGSKFIKDIKLYNTALTDQELIALTS